MNQHKAISISRTTNHCLDSCDLFLPRAQRELGAFARAVEALFGSARVRESIEDWLQELESIDWWAGGAAIPDWRRVTIAAAARLAGRVGSKTNDEREESH